MNAYRILFICVLLVTSTVVVIVPGPSVQGAPSGRTLSRAVTDDQYELIVPLGDQYSLSGTHNYSKRVVINGTLYITAYDGVANSPNGTLTINAPVIDINSIVDGSGRGYGAGGGGGGGNTFGNGGKAGTLGNGGNGGDGSAPSGGGGGGSPNGIVGLNGNNGQAGSALTGGNGATSTAGFGQPGGAGGLGYGGGGGGGGGGNNGAPHSGGGGGGGGTGGADGSNGGAAGGNGGAGGGSYGGASGVGTVGASAFGGNGGAGGYSAVALNNDKTTDQSIRMGSGGGGGGGGLFVGGFAGGAGGGGSGGGSLVLNASDTITIGGTVRSLGSLGANGGGGSGADGGKGGPGSGGGVVIIAHNLSLTGSINVTSPSVGGTIKIFTHRTDLIKQNLCYYTNGRLYLHSINQAPQAFLTVDHSKIGLDSQVVFSSLNSIDPDGDTLISKYDFGDGYGSDWSANPVAHNYTRYGNFQATVTVKDGFGGEDTSAPVLIHINLPPTPALSTKEAAGKVGQIIHLSANMSTDPDGTVAFYNYEFGDGDSSGWFNASSVIHMYREIGVYYPSVRVRDDTGAQSNGTAFTQVEITKEGLPSQNLLPTAVLTTSLTEVLTKIPVQFNGTGSTDADGKVSQYLFDLGDKTFTDWSLSPTLVHSYGSPGNYTVTLKVMDNAGDISTNEAKVTVHVSLNQPPSAVLLHEPLYGTNSVTLNWTLNHDSDFLRYEVHSSIYSVFTPSSDTLTRYIDDQATTTETLGNVANPQKLFFRVRVVDTAAFTADSNIVPVPGSSSGGNTSADHTTLSFSVAYKAKGATYISENTLVTLYPPTSASAPKTYYRLDQGTVSSYTEPFSLGKTTDGPHVIYFYTVSGGNTEPEQRRDLRLDTTKPALTISSPSPNQIFSTRSLTTTWTGSDDGSGLARYEVSSDDTQLADMAFATSHDFNDLSEGNHLLKVRASDNLGHATEVSVSVLVDTTVPEVTILSPVQGAVMVPGKVSVTWDSKDAGSGTSAYFVRLDSGDFQSVGNVTTFGLGTVGVGYHIITVRSMDKAGNVNDATTTIEVKKEKKTTTTTTGGISAVDLLVLLMVLVLVIVIVAQAFILRKSREMKRRRRLR